ncbi:hypothetical protein EW146_g2003 [Bondarzewia mesenterica]|uniref:Uncharacterized protein n=1 Tax=Bondarzewia mesenterica TaxID=1095465 RepID=A0A4S4M8A7_9AGAM|nr:hypothetical protein EW146_g2003 [Bondarzewia mesenterica]
MFVNLSGLCATTKLLQCRSMGIYMCDVTRKFHKSPEEVPDLDKEDFLARKQVVKQVQKWVNDHQESDSEVNEWIPILYGYERDWGHLVFTDPTLTRFLLVMCFGERNCRCGNHYHHDYDSLTQYQANRLMSLLTYLNHDSNKPNWVHATYTTTPSRGLPAEFLDNLQAPESQRTPPIFHITPDNFVPSLLAGELEKIDNLLAQSEHITPPAAELRDKVLGSKKDRPEPEAWMASILNAFERHRCKLVSSIQAYDDGDHSQKAAWPSHKPICKQAKTNATK